MLNHQKGIGLIEVLVALLLLAVAVLGFSAMQMRAIKATEETLVRSDAMVIIRNISEDMRLYPTNAQKNRYITALNVAIPDEVITDTTCSAGKPCNEQQQLTYNANQMRRLAQQSGISIGARMCPEQGGGGANNLQRVCIIASWGETRPVMEGTLATASTDNACATAPIAARPAQDGQPEQAAVGSTYKPGAKCFIVETY